METKGEGAVDLVTKTVIEAGERRVVGPGKSQDVVVVKTGRTMVIDVVAPVSLT